LINALPLGSLSLKSWTIFLKSGATGFRADLIVEDLVIVEIKSAEVLAPVHKRQLLTYLRLADKRLGQTDHLQTRH
jgi:GxxExxY protein